MVLVPPDGSDDRSSKLFTMRGNVQPMVILTLVLLVTETCCRIREYGPGYFPQLVGCKLVQVGVVISCRGGLLGFQVLRLRVRDRLISLIWRC